MDKKEVYFSKNIGHLLMLSGKTQQEFAEMIGKKKSVIGAYMSQGVMPRVDALLDISNYFGIPVDDILTFDLRQITSLENMSEQIDTLKTKSTQNVTLLNDDTKTKSKKNVTIEKGHKKGHILNKNEKHTKCYPLQGAEQVDVNDDVEVKKFKLKTDNNQEQQLIPLYDIEAFAGLVPLFKDTGTQTPVDYINIPNLPKCDGAVHVTGDSMYPLLKSGDIVLYKQINDVLNNIFWGEMYLVSIDVEGEEYVSVKYIQKSEKKDHIKLVSHNQHHSDKNVRIDRVKALAFVKASIRINSMK